MADPLASLTRFKIALDDANPSVPSADDAKLEAALSAASSLVRNYTGRTFEIAAPGALASPRGFEYDGNGYLDIDECQNIVGLTTRAGYTGSLDYNLTADEWAAYPLNLPVKTWLVLPHQQYGGISPEMGFTYNLDTYGYLYPFKPNIVTVTAVWGWTTIPDDVIQAVIWTAASIAVPPHEYQSESIENYSRVRGPGGDTDAIPERAKDALEPYIVPRI